MRKSGHNLTNSEIKSLLSRLDRDCDGKVSYDEFKEIFFLIFPLNYNKLGLKEEKTKESKSSNTTLNKFSNIPFVQSNLEREKLNISQKDVVNTLKIPLKEPFQSTISSLNGNFSPLRDTLGKINYKANSNAFSPPIRNENCTSNLPNTNTNLNIENIISQNNNNNNNINISRSINDEIKNNCKIHFNFT